MTNYQAIEFTFPTWHDSDPPEALPELIAMAQERNRWLGIGLLPPRHGKERIIRAALEQIPDDIHITQEERWAVIDYMMGDRGSLETEAQARSRQTAGLVFQFALATGMRHGEIDKLQWSDVGDTELQVRETKNPKNRYLPITPSMRTILDRRAGETRSRFVFTRSGQSQPKFYNILAEGCRAARVPYGNDPNGIIIHDCRHTVTTDLLRAGTDLSTIQSLIGHSDRTMILYYSHPSGETRSRAAKVMEAVLERKIA